MGRMMYLFAPEAVQEGLKRIPATLTSTISTKAKPHQGWKERHAWEDIQLINKLMDGYKDGTISYYYEAE